jgi:protein TonB
MRLGSAVHAMFMVFILVACATKPVVVHPPKPTQPEPPPTTLPETPAPDASASAPLSETEPPAPPASPALYEASSADYRRDAARHIYRRLPARIYKGKLPPMLKAVVVVDIHIEPSGQIGHIDWVRVPKHAPEVKQEIEQAIIQSAPFPAPSQFKRVRYTETWLWHKSGRFQLDTLTEGQH